LTSPPSAVPARRPEHNRAIAFFDATYAVALTLLVTTLEIDNRPSAFTSLSALDRAVGAQFVAFAIAFAVARISWLLLVVVNPVGGTWITRRR
jgi:uncharacterized membrane protein